MGRTRAPRFKIYQKLFLRFLSEGSNDLDSCSLANSCDGRIVEVENRLNLYRDIDYNDTRVVVSYESNDVVFDLDVS